MNLNVVIDQAELQRLALKSGDVLVLRCPERWSAPDDIGLLREQFADALAVCGIDWPFLVLPHDLELEVVAQEAL